MSDMPREQQWRQARIVKMIEDHAHRFHAVCPGSEARYVLEGWVKDATPDEWDYAYAHVNAHPELFTTMPRLTQDQVRQRDHDNARYLDEQAAAALKHGDPELALYLLDAAEWTLPGGVVSLDRKRALCAAALDTQS